MALAESGTLLVGGHTSETNATTVGFAVTGTRLHAPTPPRLEEDPVLVITKPVGTGVLMAGAMQLVADGDWVKSALASMAVSNGIAADLLAADCPVMTDVTGFGLARHALNLAERCRYTGVEITLSAVPLLDGADILLDKGVRSSLHDQNAASVRLAESVAESAQQAALFDPQTSGGLLAALPRVRAEAAIDRLRAAGQTGVIIGRLTNAWTGLYSARKG
jgi:selenide,water dikinase